MSRLREKYDAEIKSAMTEKFGYKNEMQIPKLVKIVINMGVGEARENAKVLDAAIKDLENNRRSEGSCYTCEKVSC